jgi:glycosyltransferase involved in cell wall biosynthesis
MARVQMRKALQSNGQIRVLHILVGLTIGGVERQLQGVLPRLRELGFHNTICALKGWDALGDWFLDRHIPTLTLNGRGRLDLRVLWRLLRVIKSIRPHILCSYTARANWAGILAGRIAGVPVVVTSVREIRQIRSPLERMCDRALLGWCDAMVVPSEAVRAHELAQGSIDPRRLCVIPNGVDSELFHASISRERARKELGLPPEGYLVGYLGRLEEPTKGVGVLLNAYKFLQSHAPRTMLIIGGCGPSEGMLRKMADHIRLGDTTRFIGPIEDPSVFLRGIDVLAVPSLREGCPNVVLEAMACGVPFVASDIDGVREIVDHGRTGWLVPSADPRALAEGILRLLEDRDLAHRLTTRAVEWVRKERPMEETARAYGRLLLLLNDGAACTKSHIWSL